MEGILTILLAGGAGERLAPLTRDQPKPMMPFGGIYRLIDLTLSNCLNSGLSKIYVLTQYKALSLNRHIRQAWNILSPELGQFIEAVPPTQRLRDTWYLGTADAVYQNMQSIVDERLPYVLILSADHVYKMNYAHMLDWHVERGADVTVATTQISPSDSARFGIVSMDDDYSIQAFEEKPPQHRAARSHFRQDACSASMGVYLFSTSVLLEALKEDAEDQSSSHDFGRDVLPRLMGRRRVVAYDFVDENKKEQEGHLLARRGHPGSLLRSQYGSGRGDSGVQSVRPGLAPAHVACRLCPPRSLFSPRRAGAWDWRWIRSSRSAASSPEAG